MIGPFPSPDRYENLCPVDIENVATDFQTLLLAPLREEAVAQRIRQRDKDPILHYNGTGLEGPATGLLCNKALRLQVVIEAETPRLVFEDEERLLPPNTTDVRCGCRKKSPFSSRMRSVIARKQR